MARAKPRWYAVWWDAWRPLRDPFPSSALQLAQRQRGQRWDTSRRNWRSIPRSRRKRTCTYQGLAGAALKEAIAWCLEWSALQDRACEPVKQLSGGMKRRLNMAAGLIHRPAIALFDEPTVGVDPQSRERIYSMIEGLHRAGVSAIYTTHYMEEAERLCDRIAIVDHGQVIALGTNAELVRDAFGQQCGVAIHLGAEPSAAGAAWIAERGGLREGLAVHFSVTSPADEVGALLAAARDQQLEIRDLALKAPNLESVFLHLTGRELRE